MFALAVVVIFAMVAVVLDVVAAAVDFVEEAVVVGESVFVIVPADCVPRVLPHPARVVAKKVRSTTAVMLLVTQR